MAIKYGQPKKIMCFRFPSVAKKPRPYNFYWTLIKYFCSFSFLNIS